MLVPLYNAELAPPEVRGALVALQQLAITFGIMISYWIGYGTNFIGGTGEGQSDAAWLIPICIQLLPSTTLAAGMLIFMPQSPRHLMNKGREAECLETLARLRSASAEDIKVRIEFLEIKAARDFELLRRAEKFPNYQDGSFKSNFKIGFYDYLSLVTNKSMLKRTMVAVLVMVFQQWNGVGTPSSSRCMGLTTTLGQRNSLLCAFHLQRLRTERYYDFSARYRCCRCRHVSGNHSSCALRGPLWTKSDSHCWWDRHGYLPLHCGRYRRGLQ